MGTADKLRDLVNQTTGSISWVGNDDWRWWLSKNTATVTIDGKTQEYNVKDGLVYVNGNQVGYMENDSIMVEEADFNRDFNIAGTITLYNFYDENNLTYISSYNISGHTWIGYRTIDGRNITVSTGYQTYTGSAFTASTWEYKAMSVLNRGWDQSHIGLDSTISYSKNITKNQEQQMLDVMNSREMSTWSVYRTCTTYANSVFFSATGIFLGDISIVQPKGMMINIENRKKYDEKH